MSTSVIWRPVMRCIPRCYPMTGGRMTGGTNPGRPAVARSGGWAWAYWPQRSAPTPRKEPDPMRLSLPARLALAADLDRLRQQQLVVIALDALPDLVRVPDADPFAPSRSSDRAGIEELAATLVAARRLPGSLTVRVVLPPGVPVEPSVPDAEAALRRRAAYLSTVAWRDSMAVRAMGLRQLPVGIAI